MPVGEDYRAVFEASPDATLIVDSDGIIRDLNLQALSMFGWSREEMLGSPVERLVPKANSRGHQEHRRRYNAAPKARPMGVGLELLALRSDGSTFPVEISLSPWKLASGGEHVICAVRDITQWKRIRRLSRVMLTAAENERKSLSRELHDEFLQYLVALKIRVKLLAAEPDEEERERARLLIAGEIHDAMRGAKRLIRGLLPPELEYQGLVFALHSQFRDVQAVYGFTIQAHLEPVDDALDSVAALALYRIVQEAVTNAVRHAGVDEATVTLRVADEVVTAEIRDRGRGFDLSDPGALGGDGHVGITGMRERAAMVGGGMKVHSSPGGGTTVRVTLPRTGPDGAGEHRGDDR